jgi:hypothetical protein
MHRQNAAGVDNTYRRKWNKEDFVEKAREREDKVPSLPSSFTLLLFLFCPQSRVPKTKAMESPN